MNCPDPPHRKPCSYFSEALGYETVDGRRTRVVPTSEFSHSATKDWDSLELLADTKVPPAAVVSESFLLRVPGVTEGVDDDLSRVLDWVEWGSRGGCQRLLCGAPLSGDKSYRHRWLTLVRGLCDEHGLDFVILERADTPAGWLLNRFLATKKECCRTSK